LAPIFILNASSLRHEKKGEEKYMKIRQNRIAAVIISLLMVTTLGGSGIMLAHAQSTANEIPTFAFINVAPNPCGVGQTVTVNFWLGEPLVDSERATNMTVKVNTPNAGVTTLGPFTSDLTGGTFTTYTPTATGTYTFQLLYGGQTLKGGGFNPFNPQSYAGYIEEPAQSQPVNLTVTNTPATGIPFTPLPKTWWQTPINAENTQNWAAISGSWMGYLSTNTGGKTGEYNDSGSYNPFTTTPTSAHILWTKPWCVGGVAGGELGNNEQASDYWTASQYEPKFAPVIMDGILYSTWYTTNTGGQQGIQAVNLFTGQTMFVINTTDPLRCGMIVNFENVNQYGDVGPYVITSSALGNWYLYDGLTGQYECEIANAPAFLFVGQDPNGNIIGYAFNSTTGVIHSYPNGRFGMFGNPIAPVTYPIQNTTIYGSALVMYNLTAAMQQAGGLGWTIVPGTIYQWQDGVEWVTQSIPPVVKDTSTGQNIVTAGLGLSPFGLAEWSGNVLVMTAGDVPVEETFGWEISAGISATNGQLLWITNRTGGIYVPYTRTTWTPSAANGVYVEINQVTYDMVAYSLQTGKQVWTSTLNKPMSDGNMPNTYDEFYFVTVPDSSTGVLYAYAFGGDVWAINMTNGNVIWSWSTIQANGPSGTETPYGIYPLWVYSDEALAGLGSDTMLYITEGHEYSPPLFHGAHILALNATTGKLVWDSLGFDCTATAVADGILTTFNSYDGQIYGYGQGPSKTTVSAPNPVTSVGSPIVIAGTVTDVSAGSRQEAVAANFPNGLQCVSDASMSQFMEAVYEQQPMPTNITGVPVTFTVVDSNNNCRPIGSTTTNALGDYSFMWKPDIPGNYTLYVTFAGTGAYYGSSASTGFYASSPAPTAAATATPLTGLASNTTLMYGIVAIAIIIIVIGAVLAILVTRRHP
jgi:hypothetical protein